MKVVRNRRQALRKMALEIQSRFVLTPGLAGVRAQESEPPPSIPQVNMFPFLKGLTLAVVGTVGVAAWGKGIVPWILALWILMGLIENYLHHKKQRDQPTLDTNLGQHG